MASADEKMLKKELMASLKGFEKEALLEAQKVFKKNKEAMLNKFREHPVTVEINQGPESANTSNTLEGYGNLFSYIGFEQGSSPTEIVENKLNKETTLSKRVSVKQKGDGVIFEFQVETPDLASIGKDSPMPFEQGRSWVSAIERGISGLSYYIYGKLLAKSRSGSGIQSNSKARNLNYKPVKYMSAILNNFDRSFKK